MPGSVIGTEPPCIFVILFPVQSMGKRFALETRGGGKKTMGVNKKKQKKRGAFFIIICKMNLSW